VRMFSGCGSMLGCGWVVVCVGSCLVILCNLSVCDLSCCSFYGIDWCVMSSVC